MEYLNLGERHAFRMKNCTNFVKSWIVFKACALNDDVMRGRIESGFKPWKTNHGDFSFDVTHCAYNRDDVDSLKECRDEWNCFMERWYAVCFKNPYFAVVKTESMGLGVVCKRVCSFELMSQKLDGFLEFVSFPQFSSLRFGSYNSVFNFIDENGIQHWCILFGPLALVNSDESKVHVGFSNYDMLGKELFWETVYSRSRYTVVQEDMTISGFYSTALYNEFFHVDRDEEDQEGVAYTGHELSMITQFETVGELLVRKISMFNRVKMSYLRNHSNVFFAIDEEVMISYII